jgi:hypothetical protein
MNIAALLARLEAYCKQKRGQNLEVVYNGDRMRIGHWIYEGNASDPIPDPYAWRWEPEPEAFYKRDRNKDGGFLPGPLSVHLQEEPALAEAIELALEKAGA